MKLRGMAPPPAPVAAPSDEQLGDVATRLGEETA